MPADSSSIKHFFGMAAALISLLCAFAAVSAGDNWTLIPIETDGDDGTCSLGTYMGTKNFPSYKFYGLWYYGYFNRVRTFKKDGKCKYIGGDEDISGLDDAPKNYEFTASVSGLIEKFANPDFSKKTWNNVDKYADAGDIMYSLSTDFCISLKGTNDANCDDRVDVMGAVNGARAFTIMVVIFLCVKFYFLFKKEPNFKVCFILSVLVAFLAMLAIAIWAGGVQNNDKGIKEANDVFIKKIKDQAGITASDPVAGTGLADMIVVLLLELFLGISYFMQMRSGESTA